MGISLFVLFISFVFLIYEVDNLYSDISFKADVLTSGNVGDPLSVYDQCHESNTVTLEVNGGSGYYEWSFTGKGIDVKPRQGIKDQGVVGEQQLSVGFICRYKGTKRRVEGCKDLPDFLRQ